MDRSALLLAAALFAAPFAARAEGASPPAGAAATPQPAEAQPVSLNANATQGVVVAVYKKWTTQAEPKFTRADAPADEAPKIEIQGKDEWADEYGLKFAFNRLSYKARF